MFYDSALIIMFRFLDTQTGTVSLEIVPRRKRAASMLGLQLFKLLLPAVYERAIKPSDLVKHVYLRMEVESKKLDNLVVQ